VAGIDAPEKKQPFGQKSKENLAALVFNRNVEIVGDKKDRYGRTVAKIMISDPDCRLPKCDKHTDAGLQQVMSGLAWWYKKYQKEQSPDDRKRYEQAEIAARNRRLGLWTDPEPMAPWDWRHHKH
jgi:endonuclease YncB( thermonuclease family)